MLGLAAGSRLACAPLYRPYFMVRPVSPRDNQEELGGPCHTALFRLSTHAPAPFYPTGKRRPARVVHRQRWQRRRPQRQGSCWRRPPVQGGLQAGPQRAAGAGAGPAGAAGAGAGTAAAFLRWRRALASGVLAGQRCWCCCWWRCERAGGPGAGHAQRDRDALVLGPGHAAQGEKPLVCYCRFLPVFPYP